MSSNDSFSINRILLCYVRHKPQSVRSDLFPVIDSTVAAQLQMSYEIQLNDTRRDIIYPIIITN